nr:MAG TPA: hypothetical protein [Caudoviricetes sp.]DAW72670.1 MAG TPA: hypothetical protein [Caudoviricetes sp.]
MGQAVMDIKKSLWREPQGKGIGKCPRYICKKHSINMEIFQAF